MSLTAVQQRVCQLQLAEKLPPHLLCDACKQPLYNGFQTPHGCRLCQLCVANKLPANGTVRCPGQTQACRDEDEEIDINQSQVFPDMATRRELGRLKVHCPNRSSGCRQSLKWKEAEAHLQQCEFEPVACDQCGDAVLRKSLRHHRSSECRQRQVKCKDCGRQVVLSEMDSVHRNLVSESCCPKHRAACPHCGDKSRRLFDRSSFLQHLPECPERPEECRYRHLGCDFVAKRSEVQKHLRSSADAHLEMLDRCLRSAGAAAPAAMTPATPSAPPAAPPAAAAASSSSEIPNSKLQDMQKQLDSMYEMFKKLANRASIMMELEPVIASLGRLQQQTARWTESPGQLQQLLRKQLVRPEHLPPHLGCIKCSRPVIGCQQTQHGNRMCAVCFNTLPPAAAREEDQQRVTRSSCRPDTAARREVGQLRVACPNCWLWMPWKEMEWHLRRCPEVPRAQGAEQAVDWVLLDRRLQKLHRQLQQVESTSYDGRIVWAVDLSRDDKKRPGVSLLSPPFYSDRFGHRYCARLFPNGDVGKGSNATVELLLQQGDFDDVLEWPHAAEVTFRLVNRRDRTQDVVKTAKLDSGSRRPSGPDDTALTCGAVKLAAVRDIRDPKFLKDGSLLLQVTVEQAPRG